MATRTHAFLDLLAADPIFRKQAEDALQRLARRLDLTEATADDAATSTSLSTHIADTTTHGISTFGATVVDDGSAADVRTTIGAAASGAVTASGLTMSTARMLGRTTAGTGAIEEITVGSGLSLAAGALTSTVTAYTDEQAQDAIVAMWVDGHAIDSVYVDGTPTFTVAVDEAEFATGPGLITPAMLDNGTARTLLGRAANSSGARADIAGAGSASAPQVASDDGTTVAFRDLRTLVATVSTIYEIDYSTLATNDFADGTESIDSIDWTCVNRASATLFEVTNGTGLRWSVPASTARTFLSGSQTSAYIYTTLGAIFTRAGLTRDAQCSYVLEFYFSSLVREQNGETPVVGFWDATDTVLRGVSLRQNAGAYNLGMQQSSSTYSTIDSGSGANVITVMVSPTGAGVNSVGTWSSGWPEVEPGLIQAANTGQGAFTRSDTRVVIAGGITASDASPTTAWTLRQMRLRRVG